MLLKAEFLNLKLGTLVLYVHGLSVYDVTILFNFGLGCKKLALFFHARHHHLLLERLELMLRFFPIFAFRRPCSHVWLTKSHLITVHLHLELTFLHFVFLWDFCVLFLRFLAKDDNPTVRVRLTFTFLR